MADVSLPGDTGAFMDDTMVDPRDLREGAQQSLRKMRTLQAKTRKRSKERTKAAKQQVSNSKPV